MKFNEYSFRDLLINIVDNRGRTCPTVEQGIPLIATNCIQNTGLYPVYEKLRYVSEETYNSWFRDHPKPGDMVFVCKGSPGRVCWVPNPVPFCIAQDMVAIRADEGKVYPKYLFALLRSDAVQNQILNMHVGTLIPHFKKGDFSNLYLQIPEDMEYQKQVGDAYFSFCEKIDSNNQINKTLEQMAQAIFKSWFVDFEPVRAKIAVLEAGGSAEDALLAAMQAISGKNETQLTLLQAEQPEQYAELRATAELFPSAMQESELGEIPEGWDASTIGQSFILTMGQSPPGDTYNEIGEGVPFYQGRTDFGFRFPIQRVFCTEPTRLAQTRDSLVSVRAPVGDVNVALQQCALGRGVAGLRHPKGHQSFVFYSARSLKLHFELYNGEGTVFGSINKKDFQNLPIVIPSANALKAFENTVAPLDSRIETNEHIIRTLSELRGTLLLKLLSGELRLPEAEAQIQEAADAV